MKVLSASFLKSVLRPEEFPRDRRPEFAFVGRSNVGKSSLLNVLLNRRNLAKTSGTPGKTQTINFFDVNGRIYFVDLPGYGFAHAPRDLQAKWGQVMTAYLTRREPLRLVVALLDARHEPSDKDLDMLELLEGAEVPTLIVATKIDKLNRSERERNLHSIREKLQLDPDALIIPFSAVTGEGAGPIWAVIDDVLSSSSKHTPRPETREE
jgi:GTP-binding protein